MRAPSDSPIGGDVAESELTDAQAVARVLDGDIEVFEVLVRRHQAYLFRLLSRHLPASEVGEAAQETLLDAFEKLSRLREPERFRSWLSAIALRRGADFWRANARRKERSVDFSSPEELALLGEALSDESVLSFEELARRREAQKLVALLLDGLAPEDRLALELFYCEEYTLAEIGMMLDWGESKVKVRLHRARKKMALKAEGLLGSGGRP